MSSSVRRSPELDPSALKIDKLIQKIENGEIVIPAFQRGFVWKQEQVIELLESIENGYPIGSALLWNTKEKLKNARNIAGYEIPSGDPELPANYVLDGQQRISTIYGVFSTSAKQEEARSDYHPKKDIFEIYYDLDKKAYIPKSDIDDESNCTIYLRDLLHVTTLMEALKYIDENYHNNVQSLVSKFNNYEIPLVTIKNRTKEEVAVIFERINNTGTKLSIVNLMVAWTWTEDFHLIEELEKLQNELAEKGFEGINNTILLQIISGVLKGENRY